MEKKIHVLFGAGLNAQKILKEERDKSKFLDASVVICDNDLQKQNAAICGIRVIGFEEVMELYKGGKIDKIIFTPAIERELLYQCILAGIEIDSLYYWDMEKSLIRPIWEKYTRELHSQDGEELFLRELLYSQDNGIYVDVGAYHPFRFSNTYWAYLKGWRGINIEPDIINYELLKTFRKDDININCGISDVEMQLEYYMFKETGLNTFCKDEIENKDDIVGIRKVAVRRLDTILEEYGIRKIDFMDIDVEGMELKVLNSIDWNHVKIRYLLVEQRNMSLHDVIESEVCKFLEDKGYSPVSKYNRTVIYVRSDRKV